MLGNQLFKSANALLYINNSRYGRAVSLNVTSETPTRSIETIDEWIPAEIAPTRARVRGEITCFRIAGDGGLEGAGITPQFSQLPLQKYLNITIRDRVTQETIFQAEYCMVDSQSWRLATRELMTGSFSFTGITWGNEASASGGVNASAIL